MPHHPGSAEHTVGMDVDHSLVPDVQPTRPSASGRRGDVARPPSIISHDQGAGRGNLGEGGQHSPAAHEVGHRRRDRPRDCAFSGGDDESSLDSDQVVGIVFAVLGPQREVMGGLTMVSVMRKLRYGRFFPKRGGGDSEEGDNSASEAEGAGGAADDNATFEREDKNPVADSKAITPHGAKEAPSYTRVVSPSVLVKFSQKLQNGEAVAHPNLLCTGRTAHRRNQDNMPHIPTFDFSEFGPQQLENEQSRSNLGISARAPRGAGVAIILARRPRNVVIVSTFCKSHSFIPVVQLAAHVSNRDIRLSSLTAGTAGGPWARGSRPSGSVQRSDVSAVEPQGKAEKHKERQ
eukprot:SAG22_NODE_74_length_22289_cov_65.265119_7_plen_348_part_00